MDSENQAVLATYISWVCTPLSFFGCCYMISSYFNSGTKSFSAKLIFCLALSDLVLCLLDAYQIFNPDDQNCTIVGFIRIAATYSNRIWTTQILAVLFVQFVMEYTGVPRLFPYLVASNILLSLTPSFLTVYEMNFGGSLYFGNGPEGCTLLPTSGILYVLLIPFAVMMFICIFLTVRVYTVFKNMATNVGNIEYKALFMFPAVLILLDVPIDVDYATNHTNLWLNIACAILFKSLGLINALQFRKASNSRGRFLKETQGDVILRTLSETGESSLNSLNE